MIESHKICGLLLAVALSVSMTVTAQAAPNTAQTISGMTGWDVADVQIVLEESFLEDSEITPEQAEAALLGEMRSYWDDLYSCEVKFECIATIAAFETGHFQYMHGNNVGGIVGASGYLEFQDVQEGITALDKLLMEQYLSEDGAYYEEGTTVLEVAQHYNTSIEWLAGYVDVRLSMQRRIDKEESSC